MADIGIRLRADGTQFESVMSRANASVGALQGKVEGFNNVAKFAGMIAGIDLAVNRLGELTSRYNQLIGIVKGQAFFESAANFRAMAEGLGNIATQAEAAYEAMRLTAAGVDMNLKQFRALGEAGRGLAIAGVVDNIQDAMLRFSAFLVRGETEGLEKTGVSIKMNPMYEAYARQVLGTSRFGMTSTQEMQARVWGLFSHPSFTRMQGFGTGTEATGLQQFRVFKQEAVDEYVRDVGHAFDLLTTSILKAGQALGVVSPQKFGNMAGDLASVLTPSAIGGMGMWAGYGYMAPQVAGRWGLAAQLGEQEASLTQRMFAAQNRVPIAMGRLTPAMQSAMAFEGGGVAGAQAIYASAAAGGMGASDLARINAVVTANRTLDSTTRALAETQKAHAAATRAAAQSQTFLMGSMIATGVIIAATTAWQAYSNAVRDSNEALKQLAHVVPDSAKAGLDLAALAGGGQVSKKEDLVTVMRTRARDLGLSGDNLTRFSDYVAAHADSLLSASTAADELAGALRDLRVEFSKERLGQQTEETKAGVGRRTAWAYWLGPGAVDVMRSLTPFDLNRGGLSGALLRGNTEVSKMSGIAVDALGTLVSMGIMDENAAAELMAKAAGGGAGPGGQKTAWEKFQGEFLPSGDTARLLDTFAAQTGYNPKQSFNEKWIDQYISTVLGMNVAELTPQQRPLWEEHAQRAMEFEREKQQRAVVDELDSITRSTEARKETARWMDIMNQRYGVETDKTAERAALEDEYRAAIEKAREVMSLSAEEQTAYAAYLPELKENAILASEGLAKMAAEEQAAARALSDYMTSLDRAAGAITSTIGAQSTIMGAAAGPNKWLGGAYDLIGQIEGLEVDYARWQKIKDQMGKGGLKPDELRQLQSEEFSARQGLTSGFGRTIGGVFDLQWLMQDIPYEDRKYLRDPLFMSTMQQLNAGIPSLLGAAITSGTATPEMLAAAQRLAATGFGIGDATAFGAEYRGKLPDAYDPISANTSALEANTSAISGLTSALAGGGFIAGLGLPPQPPGAGGIPDVGGVGGGAGWGPAPKGGYTVSGIGYPLPVGNNRVTSTYYAKRSSGLHGGGDIAAAAGTPVMAYSDLEILQEYDSGASAGGGRALVARDALGNVAAMHHLRNLQVAVGDLVKQGEQLAEVYRDHLDIKLMSGDVYKDWRSSGGLPPWRKGQTIDWLKTGYFGPYDSSSGTLAPNNPIPSGWAASAGGGLPLPLPVNVTNAGEIGAAAAAAMAGVAGAIAGGIQNKAASLVGGNASKAGITQTRSMFPALGKGGWQLPAWALTGGAVATGGGTNYLPVDPSTTPVTMAQGAQYEYTLYDDCGSGG